MNKLIALLSIGLLVAGAPLWTAAFAEDAAETGETPAPPGAAEAPAADAGPTVEPPPGGDPGAPPASDPGTSRKGLAPALDTAVYPADTAAPAPSRSAISLMACALVYIIEAFLLFLLAKIAYGKFYRPVELNAELFKKDNLAVAVSTVGYYFGVLIALGGAISGDSAGLGADVVGIAIYGIVAIVLMLLASVMCERVLLPKFNNTKEVVEDKNLGVAFVEAGIYIANGLVILRACQSDIQSASGGARSLGSSLVMLLVFWVLAQVVLVIAGRVYELMTPHKIHEELEKDNAAVGLAFCGALIGMGNIVSLAVAGEYSGLGESLSFFVMDAIFGFIMLAIIHKATDLVLAPGVKLSDEETQETPNIGAGLLEAFGYIGGSMLIVWSL